MPPLVVNKVVSTPLLLSSDSSSYYVKPSAQDLTIYAGNSASPLYRLNEPVFMVHAAVAQPQEVHLAFLKTNGDLCYSIITESGTKQMTILAKLDVRTTRYCRLLVFPLGGMVHIFYASAHQSISDLWRIEHRLWDGKSWRSVHLGEVVNSREPLYTVSRDNQGNLHLLMITSQGTKSLLLFNRFHGIFALWGTTMQAFTIPREITHMASIMTQDNIHHLFWIGKNINQKLELGWAYRTGAHDLASIWSQTPAPIKIFSGTCRGLGTLDLSGSIWLLAHFEQAHLLVHNRDSWKTHSVEPPAPYPLQIARQTIVSIDYTYWLEEKPRVPQFAKQIGLPELPIHQPIFTQPMDQSMAQPITQPAAQPMPQPTVQATVQPPAQTQESPAIPDLQMPSISEATMEALDPPSPTPGSEVQPSAPDAVPPPSAAIEEVSPSAEPPLAEVASSGQSHPSPSQIAGLLPLLTDALSPILKTIVELEQQSHNLAKALEAILFKHEQTESQLKNLEHQISLMHTDKDISEKGFWGKWFR